MDLPPNQLRTFVVAARRLSYTRAAEELYLTQPAVSAHIRKLERATGTVLFEQIGRSVALTPAGHVLLRYAERMLGLEEELRAALSETSQACEGLLAIGASTTIGVSLLPRLLREFLARYPRVSLRLQIGNVPEVVLATVDGRLDLSLIAGESADDRLEVRPFMEDELVLVVPPAHPWSAVTPVEPDDLADEPLILREPGSTTRAAVEQWLSIGASGLNIAAEVNNNEAIVRAVELGLGVAIVSKYSAAAELETGRLRRVPLGGGRLTRNLNLILRKGKHRSPAMRAFQDLLPDWAESL